MEDLERELYMDVLKFRGLIDAGILSTLASRDKKALNAPYDALTAYSELALPYKHKKDKMLQSAGIDDKEHWVKFLAERKKQKDLAKQKKET